MWSRLDNKTANGTTLAGLYLVRSFEKTMPRRIDSTAAAATILGRSVTGKRERNNPSLAALEATCAPISSAAETIAKSVSRLSWGSSALEMGTS